MANPEHVEIVKQGAEAVERWRAENPDTCLDLSGAELSLAEYHESFLANADLTGATLSDTDVSVEFLYGRNGVVQDLKTQVDSHLTRNERSKNRVRIFFRFLNWSVSKLLGADLLKTGVEFKENVEAWQLNQRVHFPASEGIELAISAFVRFVRVGFASLLIALIPISFQIAQTFLMNRQNTLINDQNKYFQEQNSKIQRQLNDEDIERRRADRNRLIDILYQEKENQNEIDNSGEPPDPTMRKRKVPLALNRLRQEAILEFIKLEHESGRRGEKLNLGGAILSGLSLTHYSLMDAGLENALQGALFTGAHLENTTFLGTNLEGAFFHRVQLERTEFTAASLAGANFSNCVLNKTDFQDANLKGAFFMNVEMHETNFENANLKGMRVSPDFLEQLNNTNIKQNQWSYDDGVLVPSAESNKPNLAGHFKNIDK